MSTTNVRSGRRAATASPRESREQTHRLLAHCIELLPLDPHRALSLADEAYRLSKKTKDERTIVAALWRLGECHHVLRDYPAALRYLKQAAVLAKDRPVDPGTKAAVLAGLARVRFECEQYEEALPLLHQALESSLETSDARLAADILVLMGDICRLLGDYPTALAFFARSLKMWETAGDREALNTAFASIDHLYALLGRGPQDVDPGNMPAAGGVPSPLLNDASDDPDIDPEHAGREIAGMAMQLARKNEFVAKLKERIHLYTKSPEPGASELAVALLTQFEEESTSESEWKFFEQQFNHVDHHFVHALSELCPSLSPAELRICALLKVNLSSKEIARFLCTTVRTVEKHRQHIRKKLNIPGNMNLSVFLASL